MSSSSLHILNGEGTAFSFRKAGIPGEVMVWNEALCQGPAPLSRELDDFLALRRPFLEEQWGPIPAETLDQFRQAWDALHRIQDFEEVVLWFEYDLFCQANLLYLSYWLSEVGAPKPTVYLVSPAEFPGKPDFRGMGQLSPAELASLLPGKQILSQEDLQFGGRMWEFWAAGDFQALEQAAANCPPAWPHLPSALQALFQELPHVQTGLSDTQSRVVQWLQTAPLSKGQLFRRFLQEKDVLGWGDLQFFELVEGMLPDLIIETEHGYQVSPQVQSLQQSQHLSIQPRWIGPLVYTSPAFPLRWNPENETIQPINP